jgi:hypothetical protein
MVYQGIKRKWSTRKYYLFNYKFKFYHTMQKKITFLIFGYFISLISLNAQGWIEVNKTVPSESDAGKYYYGYSAGIDGDYAIVGAYGYSSSQGIAYVLHNNGTTWENIAKLQASDGEASDYFGRAVSISGNTIVIGAYGDDDNGSNSGAAYVFTKPESGWADMIETAKLLPSDGYEDDRFGLRVSVDDSNIVVGAYNDDDNGLDCGSAYVFCQPVDGWKDTIQTAKITASDGGENDNFGSSVSISGNTIVVGAFQDSDIANLSGSAYVFTKPDEGWSDMTQTAKLTASDAGAYDTFGNSVSINGNTIVIGAPKDSDIANFSGSAYVFTKPVNGWVDATQDAELHASDAAATDGFGGEVSICGDTIVIGSPYDDDMGSAYVFIKHDGAWVDTTEHTKLTPSDPNNGDLYGWTVGVSGDYIVSCAYKNDDNGSQSGSAYFVQLLANKLTQSITFDALADQVYGDDTLALSATASSGLDLVFTSSNDSVVTCSGANGSVVTINGAGVCTISANQAGNHAYVEAAQVTQSLTVHKKELTVTADDKTMTRGEELPDFTLSYAGFVNNDSASMLDILPTASTTATAESAVGIYDIIVSGGSDNNYELSYVSGTLTIEKGLGISQNSLAAIELYPNPANDILNVSLADGIEQASIEFYSIGGIKIMTLDVDAGFASVNVSQLNQGSYLLHIVTENDNFIMPWIKE